MESFVGLAGAPIVAAFVSVLVKPFVSDKRFYSPAALLMGLLWNVGIAAAVTQTNIAEAAILGVVTGLAASGLYSTQKTHQATAGAVRRALTGHRRTGRRTSQATAA